MKRPVESVSPPRLLWCRDQAVVAAGVLVCLAGMLVTWGFMAWNRGGLIEPIAEPRRTASFRIDLNTALAAELDLLPNIGPALARKIIHSRQERPFASLADVAARKIGIGDKTVERMRPYLLPLPDLGASPGLGVNAATAADEIVAKPSPPGTASQPAPPKP